MPEDNIDNPIPEIPQSSQNRRIKPTSSITLLRDLKRVNDVEKRQLTIENKIVGLEATNEEVMNWYFGQDPLDESEVISIAFAGYTGNLGIAKDTTKKLERKGLIYELAAVSIISSVYFPNALDASIRKKQILETTEKVTSIKQEDITTKDIVETAINTGRKDLSLDDLGLLLLAGEMLERGSHLKISSTLKEVLSHEEAEPIIEAQRLASMIYLLVYEKAFESGTKDKDLELLGLQALCKLGSLVYSNWVSSQISFEDSRSTRERLIISMVDAIQKVFLEEDGGLLINNKLNNSMRGSFHEFIWFMDSLVYLTLAEDVSARVTPSLSYQDRPIIGYPTFNRGYDFHIYDPVRGVIKKIQLKSKPNPRHQKDYHPNIETVHEENFLDVHPGRLTNKLAIYKEFAERGFDQSLTSSVSKFILPTVVKTLSFINNQPNPNVAAAFDNARRKGAVESLRELAGPNRATRRLAEKRFKKIKKQGYIKH